MSKSQCKLWREKSRAEKKERSGKEEETRHPTSTHLDDVTPSDLLRVAFDSFSVLPLFRRVSRSAEQPVTDLLVVVDGGDLEPFEVPPQQHTNLDDIFLLHVSPPWRRGLGGHGVLLDAASHGLGTGKVGEADRDELGRVKVSVKVAEEGRDTREIETASVLIRPKKVERESAYSPTRCERRGEDHADRVNRLPDPDEVALPSNLLDENGSQSLGPQLLVNAEKVDLRALNEAVS
jgi:hypothetical protein